MQRRAFTLIELLVVISIIGILAGMLLQGTSLAMAAARKSDCLNRQRQIGLAMTAYAGENEGALPPTSVSYSFWDAATQPTVGVGNTAFFNSGLFLGAYLAGEEKNMFVVGIRAKSVFRCPADRRAPILIVNGVKNYPLSVGMNLKLSGTSATFNPAANPQTQDPGGWPIPILRPDSRANNSITAILTEAGSERWDIGWSNPGAPPMLDADVLYRGQATWGINSPNAYYDWVNFHGKGANMLFLDMHAAFSMNPTADGITKTILYR